ncbi:hypothetical protein FRC00_003013 [Tulasnella sp. 408]|nr:hypothetical protein FRC00_003013 [Tulasnella sp. 408]
MPSISRLDLTDVVIGSFVALSLAGALFLARETTPLVKGEGRTKHVSHAVERTQFQYAESAQGTGTEDHNGPLRRFTLATLGWCLPRTRVSTTPSRLELGHGDPVKAVPHPTSPQRAQRHV